MQDTGCGMQSACFGVSLFLCFLFWAHTQHRHKWVSSASNHHIWLDLTALAEFELE
jgi:hypothetical protein